MLRFLFGGLATVAGLVLLFVASFGDPSIVLDRFHGVVSLIGPGHGHAPTGHPPTVDRATSDRQAVVTGDNAPAGALDRASIGAVPNEFRPASPPVTPGQTEPASRPGSPGGAQTGSPPVLQDASQADASRAASPPVPQVQPQSQASHPVPPSQTGSLPPPHQQATQEPPAPPPPAVAEAAGLRAQREALERQLQQLQDEMAQASKSVSSLHTQADDERHSLDALEQKRAEEETRIRELDANRERALPPNDRNSPTPAAKTETTQLAGTPTATAQVAQAPSTPARDAQTPVAASPGDAQKPTAATVPDAPPPIARPLQPQISAAAPVQVTQPPAFPEASAIVAADVDRAEPTWLPLPPPLPANPPQPSTANATAPTGAPPQSTDAMASGRAAAADSDRDRLQRTAQNGGGAMKAALERLRHAQPGLAPDLASPQPDIAPRGHAAPVTRGTDSPYARPARQAGPRSRLEMAREALTGGRVDEARQYLEQAQMQLVFRPVTPTGEDAPGGSRMASDVASALSMLGAGNGSGALQYIDRAMTETRPAGNPPAASTGRLPYGGAPVAEAGQ